MNRVLRWGGLCLGIVLLAPVAAAQDITTSPFQNVNGDAWIASNARGTDGGAWHATAANRPSFGLQFGERNDLPFDKGTAAAAFWVRDAGCPIAFGDFGHPCGWKLALAITQYRSVVVGGNGVELDGLSLDPPYGRIVNASDGKARRIGLSSNIYADWSGADVPRLPRWFAGFDVGADRFEIERGTSTLLTPLLAIDNAGTLTTNAVASTQLEQHAAGEYATRLPLGGGVAHFTFARPYLQIPVCTASSEGAAPVRVAPTRTGCTITSSNGADRSIVDVHVIGNPN